MWQIARNLWAALGNNGASINATTKIIQTLVIGIGVYMTINEFILTDRKAERDKINETRVLKAEYEVLINSTIESAIPDYREDNGNKLDVFVAKEAKSIRKMYSKIQSCILADACDETLARELFCFSAYHHAKHYYYLLDYDPKFGFQQNRDPEETSLFKFVVGCPNVADHPNPHPIWLTSYRKWRGLSN